MLFTCFSAVGSSILKIAYDYTAEPHSNDLLIDMAGDAMDSFAKAGVPGAWMVDMLPLCLFWILNCKPWKSS